jgi:uncharacterized protein (TIGR02246 family)
MQKAALLIVPLLLLGSLGARGAENITCDKASLAKLETDMTAMSGKEKKRAMKQLTNAKTAFEAGDAKKCQRIVNKIAASSPKTAAQSVTTQPARASIDAVVAQFVKEFNSKDAAAAASHYAEDAAAFPPDQPRVEGRQNIQKMWQEVMDASVSDLTLTTIEVEESGNLALESGTLSFKAPGQDGKPTNIAGKYVVVWKKAADGTWQLYRDIWSADAPAKAGGG